MQKNIVGIKVRTTNENNKAMRDIGVLWDNWMKNPENISLKEGKTKNFVVYTNYEKDFQAGEYDTFIGIESEKNENFENIFVDWENFQIFQTPLSTPEASVELWQKIWKDDDLNTKRKYQFDIEEWDFEKNLLTIYISV